MVSVKKTPFFLASFIVRQNYFSWHLKKRSRTGELLATSAALLIQQILNALDIFL